MVSFDTNKLFWINPPAEFEVAPERISLTTLPDTDLWANTYYGFFHDNAHMLLMETDEEHFSFYVKAELLGDNLFDQCGVIVYQDETCWVKGNLERENERYSNLNSVVTNHGYSDFGTSPIDSATTVLYHRLSRRGSDYQLATSTDGKTYYPMRMFHLAKGQGKIRFGVYACSPSDTGCKAEFTLFSITPCAWRQWDAADHE